MYKVILQFLNSKSSKIRSKVLKKSIQIVSLCFLDAFFLLD